MIKALWKDPVWSNVIGAIISAALLGVATYFFNLWPTIAEYLCVGWGFLLRTHEVPSWILFLLVIATVPAFLLIGLFVKDWLLPPLPQQPDWTSYLSDTFYGLRWRWRYSSGTISDLRTYCPHCDYQVFALDSRVSIDGLRYRCDSCRNLSVDFEEPRLSLESKVERLIEQKIRHEYLSGQKVSDK